MGMSSAMASAAERELWERYTRIPPPPPRSCVWIPQVKSLLLTRKQNRVDALRDGAHSRFTMALRRTIAAVMLQVKRGNIYSTYMLIRPAGFLQSSLRLTLVYYMSCSPTRTCISCRRR